MKGVKNKYFATIEMENGFQKTDDKNL